MIDPVASLLDAADALVARRGDALVEGLRAPDWGMVDFTSLKLELQKVSMVSGPRQQAATLALRLIPAGMWLATNNGGVDD